jgi:aspartyl-tRNA(Asn)/glutamyl-tRNA(Gln) amidotransferase subunit C
MKVGPEDVRRVAALARLAFSPEEEKILIDQLDVVLQYVDQLGALDATGVEPLAHALDIVNAFREDRVTNRSEIEALLANAPASEQDCFKVPKIIE